MVLSSRGWCLFPQAAFPDSSQNIESFSVLLQDTGLNVPQNPALYGVSCRLVHYVDVWCPIDCDSITGLSVSTLYMAIEQVNAGLFFKGYTYY